MNDIRYFSSLMRHIKVLFQPTNHKFVYIIYTLFFRENAEEIEVPLPYDTYHDIIIFVK